MSGEASLRRRKPSLAGVMAAMEARGLKIAGVEVGADGGFKVLTADSASSQRDELAEWRARRDADKMRLR